MKARLLQRPHSLQQIFYAHGQMLLTGAWIEYHLYLGENKQKRLEYGGYEQNMQFRFVFLTGLA